MNTVKMEFEMPLEILDYVPNDDKSYDKKVKELIVYALIKEGKKSFGKGAEMLGINKIDYLTDLGKLGIPYFDESYDAIKEDLSTLDKVMEE
jgi:predicted HTH domain antitoxin